LRPDGARLRLHRPYYVGPLVNLFLKVVHL
jgi:hypothetical protein